MKSDLACLILLCCLASCRNDKTRFTESGMKYVHHREQRGAKPVLGDYVTFEMVYKTEGDSVLFDSRKNNSPFRVQLQNIPFRGSLEEGLTYLGEGDSATFFVSADSLRANMLRKHLEAGRESFLQPGSFARFDVRLIRVQRKADAEKEIAQRLNRRKEEEPRLIREFLQREDYIVVPDSNGIYVVGNQRSMPGRISKGDTVSVLYTGKYLNGVPFYSNVQTRRPLEFVVGAGEVIPGWDIAFLELAIHSKVTLVIPSAMAYGEKGLFSTEQGNYMVPPFTPLAYEVEVIAVKRGVEKRAAR